MKTIILLLTLFPLTLLAQQDWPRVGAKWIQNNEHYYDLTYEYHIIECTGDTIINNVPYRVVVDPNRFEPYYIHQDGEKFYYLFDGSLRLLYDFGVVAGDTVTFELYGLSDSVWPIDYVIDSVTQIVVDGVALEKVYAREVGFIADDFHSYNYIERIGYTRKIVQDRANTTTVPEAGFDWMRCYIDDEIEYHSEKFEASGLEDCFSDILDNTEHLFSDTEIKLLQNPIEHEVLLSINLSAFEILNYEIVDVQGRRVANGKLNTLSNVARINLANLSEGIYFLNILGNNKKAVFKFIKK